jgi:hypothetical protein
MGPGPLAPGRRSSGPSRPPARPRRPLAAASRGDRARGA